MKIGVPREIKDNENRVALTPAGARALTQAGHQVLVETAAGQGSGFSDAEYQAAGATIVDARAAWATDLVLKVKEPLAAEYGYFQSQMLFTYLHLAGVTPALTDALLQQKVTAIAYETVTDAQGRLPLLAPMSAVAGNMAALMGAYYLAKFNGGKGMLLGQVLGQRYGKVLVIGDGVVGQHAARAADAMGAQVLLFGLRREREAMLKREISPRIEWVESNEANINQHIADADLVVGAVLVPGAKAKHVVTAEMVRRMQPGSVIVDVSIDQGGCAATSRPTTHENPVYVEEDTTHYCVTNMPGAYPRTSTLALTNATLPYVLKLASGGLGALRDDTEFARGVNTCRGYVIYRAVAQALALEGRYRVFTDAVSDVKNI
jgi:alanine dehydrogenase